MSNYPRKLWARTGLNRRHQDFHGSFHPGTIGHYVIEWEGIRGFSSPESPLFCPLVPFPTR